MSRAEEPTKNDSTQVRALVNRQVQAWEKRDFAIAADDWLPNGELFSPGSHVVKNDMQSAILDYFKNFTDLKVTVNEMFLSEDGTRLAIQWDWTVTRKRDRKRATTHDVSSYIWSKEKSPPGTNTSADWSERSRFKPWYHHIPQVHGSNGVDICSFRRESTLSFAITSRY